MRRWLVWSVAVIAGFALLLALLPWWLNPVLRLASGRFGLGYARYERVGYARFELRDVVYRRDGLEVRVARVEADTPLRWAWRQWRHRDTVIVAEKWGVAVTPRKTPAPPSPSGWTVLKPKLGKVADQLNRWLPDLRAGEGVVQWNGGQLTVAKAHWHGRTLDFDSLAYRAFAGSGTVAFAEEGSMRGKIRDAEHDVTAEWEGRQAAITGRFEWSGQSSDFRAEFPSQGWMPRNASIDVPQLRLPAARLKLGTSYSEVAGKAHLEWHEGRFVADVEARGAPLAGNKAPPLEVVLHGSGDQTQLSVENLRARIPGVQAELSAPVTLRRDGSISPDAARFSMRADLAQQPWFPASGTLEGVLQVSRSPGRPVPVVNFSMSGAGLAVRGTAIRSVMAQGDLAWPVLHLESGRLIGNAGDALNLAGSWDFGARQLARGSVEGQIRRETLGEWVPETLHFSELNVSAHGAGTLEKLAHDGRVDLRSVQFGDGLPYDVRAEWHGRGIAADSIQAEVAAPGAAIRMRGAVTRGGATLSELTFAEASEERLRLTKPVRITWKPELAIDGLHLAGPTAAVEATVHWAVRGDVAVVLKEFPAAWLAHFVRSKAPNWTLSSLAVTGSWQDGPMTFSAAGGVSLPLGSGRAAMINVAVRGNGDGVVLEALHAVDSGNPVVNATGRFPVRIHPHGAERVVVDPNGALVLDAVSVPNADFWRQLATVSGLELREPQIDAHLKGTWNSPRGEVSLRAERVSTDPKRFARPMPSVEQLDVALTGTTNELVLDHVAFSIEGQRVSVNGTLPVDGNGWSELMASPFAYLQRGARLRVVVPDAEVAMFSRFLPAALAPAGRLQADLRFERGRLGGFLKLHDAASRPLGPLGVLQQVNAEVTFADRRIELTRVGATSGGQPITLSGTVELPPGDWVRTSAGEPRYDIALRGENLPFVRQAGLLVRGDLDLKLQTPAEGAPRIAGKVTLRDSLFLADVRAFLPHGGGASATRRPPYFAVTTVPLNTWGLDIEVTGNRFMRVRTPVFAGLASARFRLTGTLGEPRALGDATIDEGQILMPFATFNVRQGAVRLTEESPYEPSIFLRGTGRHYGYDLTMEITGKASAPNITFTSSPALDSEQVLLMVMTGAAPSNEVNSSLTHRAVQIGAFFGQTLVGTLTGNAAQPDRLSIETGEKISRQGKETYGIEYKLTDRWTLTGEYDEFDEYNAGFKWRVAPRKREK